MDPSVRTDADTAAAAPSSLTLTIPHPLVVRSGDRQLLDDGWTKTDTNCPTVGGFKLRKGQFSITIYLFVKGIFSFLSRVKVTV